MRRLLPLGFLALAALVATGACSKQKPSAEYAEAETLHRRLIGVNGDEGYFDPQMDQVLAKLESVPAESLDKSNAHDLIGKITAERARVTAEREAHEKALAEALKPPAYERLGEDVFPDAGRPAAEAAAAAVLDATPVPGMLLKDFEQRTAGCFRRGDSLSVTGRGQRDAWELRDLPSCKDRFKGFDTRIVIGEEGKILAVIEKSTVEMRLPDGGLAK